MSPAIATEVIPVSTLGLSELADLFAPFGLMVQAVEAGADIPGSYWGESEAGLVGAQLYLRADTPVHSALHEGAHWLCMDPARRAALNTDAGGCDVEESAVCYLQALLADQLPGYRRERLFVDMDAWGYHFRLGSTQNWFYQDSEDALAWLRRRCAALEPVEAGVWRQRCPGLFAGAPEVTRMKDAGMDDRRANAANRGTQEQSL